MMSKICLPATLLLLLLCEGLSQATQKFIQGPWAYTWKAAKNYCRERGTDLVTIREYDKDDFYNGYGWIGLNQRNSTSAWKWSRRDETAYFFNWVYSEPKKGANCAFKNKGTVHWKSDDCHLYKYFMCQEEKLVLVKENKTWEQALEHCRALEAVDPSKPATAYQNHRYDLASLLTEDDHDEAREMMRHQASTDKVWTGLHFLAGRWEWIGGGRVQYEGLDTCPTESFCGVLNKNNERVVTSQCTSNYNFLCYRKQLPTSSNG